MKSRDKRLRDSLIRLVGRSGLHVTERASHDALSRLIASLWPVAGGNELVRLGPDGDGGYLVPDDLDGLEYAYSPGVANESGFESALAARGMRVFLADSSVSGPAQTNPNFLFERKHLLGVPDDTSKTLELWKRSTIGTYSGDLLLQMDIEGAEYEVLLCSPSCLLSQFRIIVVEFHYLHELLNKHYFNIISRAFDKLLQTHAVVHIHPNNCCGSDSVKGMGLEIPRVAEFTFHRRDRLQDRSDQSYVRTFPHPLDRDNTRKASLTLPSCWHP